MYDLPGHFRCQFSPLVGIEVIIPLNDRFLREYTLFGSLDGGAYHLRCNRIISQYGQIELNGASTVESADPSETILDTGEDAEDP